jgi:hypothetical protein
MTAFVSAIDMNDFLTNHLSSSMAKLTGQQIGATPSLSTLESAYSQLRSGLGYVSLRELALAAIVDQLATNEAELFEIGAIENFLKRAAADDNRFVRMALGRAGGIAQVRIDQRAFSR